MIKLLLWGILMILCGLFDLGGGCAKEMLIPVQRSPE
jgi:hypothetical protein